MTQRPRPRLGHKQRPRAQGSGSVALPRGTVTSQRPHSHPLRVRINEHKRSVSGEVLAHLWNEKMVSTHMNMRRRSNGLRTGCRGDGPSTVEGEGFYVFLSVSCAAFIDDAPTLVWDTARRSRFAEKHGFPGFQGVTQTSLRLYHGGLKATLLMNSLGKTVRPCNYVISDSCLFFLKGFTLTLAEV